MKRIALLFALCLLLSAACKRRLSTAEIKDRLEKAMTDKLQKRQPPNGLQPHFQVLDVVYFEDAQHYDCEFKVKMLLPDGADTTGIMKGRVSKDFSTVE